MLLAGCPNTKMALLIEFPENGRTKRVNWHYSEPLPAELFCARMMKIVADGDELQILLDAIRKTIPLEPVTLDVVPNIPMLEDK